MREEDLYELATDELNSRNRKADLWARACALATDDVDEARYLYTNLRVEELAIEHEVDLTQANAAFTQELQEPDLTLALASPEGNTSSQRIPDNDDESNLTPAQLALKRVNDSMGGDSTNQLPTGLSLQDDPASAGAQSSADKSGNAKADDELELSLDESVLVTPDGKDTKANPESDSNSSGMVLGDLTSDNNAVGDNTIHIDADSSVLDIDAVKSELPGKTEKTDPDSANAIVTDQLRPEEVTLADSNAFFSDDKNSVSEGSKSTAADKASQASGIAPDNSTGDDSITPDAPAIAGTGASGNKEDLLGDFSADLRNAAQAEQAKKSNSFADESLAALMSLESPETSPASSAIETTQPASSNNDKSLPDTSSDADISTVESPESSESAGIEPAAKPGTTDTFNESDFENFSQAGTDAMVPGVRNSAKPSLRQKDTDDETAGEITELIGSGLQPAQEPAAAGLATALSAEQEVNGRAQDLTIADNAEDTDQTNVAAMQDADSARAREFAIYQHASGVVSAVPKGGNLKAMLFTLPWLVSRRLWGHSLVYLLLVLVLLMAVITTATIVSNQWPNVDMLDMGAAVAFVLLTVVGLFYLPYRLANSWQEEKIASKGYEYQSDQLAGTVAGAEQSYLLSAKNRVDTIERTDDLAEAA